MENKNKMKNFIITLLILFGIIPLFSQNIQLKFFINDKERQLNNNFSVYFLGIDSIQKVIYKPIINGNKFILPNFEFEQVIFIFQYKNKYYFIDYNNYNLNNDMEIEIKFFKNNFYKYINYDPLFDNKNTDAILRVLFEPKNFETIVMTKFIKNRKQYFYGSKMFFKNFLKP